MRSVDLTKGKGGNQSLGFLVDVLEIYFVVESKPLFPPQKNILSLDIFKK